MPETTIRISLQFSTAEYAALKTWADRHNGGNVSGSVRWAIHKLVSPGPNAATSPGAENVLITTGPAGPRGNAG